MFFRIFKNALLILLKYFAHNSACLFIKSYIIRQDLDEFSNNFRLTRSYTNWYFRTFRMFENFPGGFRNTLKWFRSTVEYFKNTLECTRSFPEYFKSILEHSKSSLE